MHKPQIAILFLGIVCVVLVGLGFSLIGNPFTQRLRELDNQRIQQFQTIQSRIESFYRTNGKLPETLVAASVGYEYTLDPETKQPFEYKIIDTVDYQLCATFSTESPNYGNYSNLQPNNLMVMPPDGNDRLMWHPKGYYCISMKIPSSIKPRATPTMMISPTPTPIEIQNVNGSTSTTKKWQPYFYDDFGMTINVPDGWEVQVGRKDSTLPANTIYISDKLNGQNVVYLYSVTKRSDLSLEDHIRLLSDQLLGSKNRAGEHSLNYLMVRGKSAVQLVTLVPAELSDASSGIQTAFVLTLFELNDKWFAMGTSYFYKAKDSSTNIMNWEEQLEKVNIYKKILQSVQPIVAN